MKKKKHEGQIEELDSLDKDNNLDEDSTLDENSTLDEDNDSSNQNSIKAKAFITKEWWKQSGSKTMGALGKLSKSFLLPIALLPIAGLFIGIGAALGQIHNASPGLVTFSTLLNQMGSVCFSNLAVLFLISAIIAYTNDSGSAVLAGIVAFLVFNIIIFSLTSIDSSHIQYSITYTDPEGTHTTLWNDTYDTVWTLGGTFGQGPEFTNLNDYVLHGIGVTDAEAGKTFINSSENVTDAYNLLFWHAVPASLYVSLLGINTLNTGVFAGVIVGCLVAYVYNRTYKVNLPTFINFFSGIKFVPIVMFFAIIPLSFVFMIIWPPLGKGLNWFGVNSGKLPYGLDSFIFEIIERSLVPFGLHHVYYAPLWWTSAGGGPLNSADYAADWTNFTKATGLTQTNFSPAVLSAVGDQTLSYAVIGQTGTYILTFKEIHDYFHLNLGRFQSGKFPFMMFGLTAASVAMWLTVPKENRKAVMGIYFSAAITCFLTGVTEPIEYTFLFVAPWLFYGVHMPLAALSFWIMGGLQVHVTQTVSGGFIDMTIFGILPDATFKTNWYWIVVIGPAFSVIYFFAFYFLIKWRDVKIPGRDGSTPTSLYTKADFKDKKGSKGKVNPIVEKASTILVALGGSENITSVDACASRLRINLKNIKIVDEATIKNLGPSALMYRGDQCQMIFGGESDVLKSTIKDIMSGKVSGVYAKKEIAETSNIKS